MFDVSFSRMLREKTTLSHVFMFSTSKTFYNQDLSNTLPHITTVNKWLHMLELPSETAAF